MKLINIGDAENQKIVKKLNEVIVGGFGYVQINVQDHRVKDIVKNERDRFEGRTQGQGAPNGLQRTQT